MRFAISTLILFFLAGCDASPDRFAPDRLAQDLVGRRVEVGHKHWLFEEEEVVEVQVLGSRGTPSEVRFAVRLRVESPAGRESLRGVCLLTYAGIEDRWYLDRVVNVSLRSEELPE